MTQFDNLQEYWNFVKTKAREEAKKIVKEGKANPRTKTDRSGGYANK